MNLSQLERGVLRFIRDQYPIAYDPATRDEIVAIGEWPLATDETIRQHFKNESPEAIGKAVRTLNGYQLVATRYLHAPGDFAQQKLAPGKILRSRFVTPGAGYDGYQVTKAGEGVIEQFGYERLKALVWKWLSKITEDYVPHVIALVLGMLISSLFGLDIRSLLKP